MISCSRATVEILMHDTTENEGVLALALENSRSQCYRSLVRMTQDGESRFCFFSDHNHLLLTSRKKVMEREASRFLFCSRDNTQRPHTLKPRAQQYSTTREQLVWCEKERRCERGIFRPQMLNLLYKTISLIAQHQLFDNDPFILSTFIPISSID